MLRLSTVVLAAVLLTACAPRPPETAAALGACPIDPVAWLEGTWTCVDGEETTVERWTREGEHRLVGEAETRRAGVRVFGERLEISCVDGRIVYTAWPEGQAMARFPATVLDGSRAVFENPAHDFPTRIEYRRDGDALTAQVSGEADGTPRIESWRFRREDVP